MDVSEIGEFGLIKRLRKGLLESAEGLAVGVGDDAAAFETPGGMLNLVTCDVQVEGVHFLRNAMTPFQIGRKSAAINISDIAAMGGQPTFMLISLGLPENTPVSFVDGLYEGLRHECGLFGVQVIGGNMAKSPERIFIDVFLLGQVKKGRALLRSGASNGDLVAVTGSLGDSAAGLALLLDEQVNVDEETRRAVVEAHTSPTPKVAEGLLLSETGLATAALDVSDGVVGDVGHICEESGLGAVLWSYDLPISDAARKVADAADANVLEYALFGGEDYQLIFTATKTNMNRITEEFEKSGTSVTIIGCMETGEPHVRVVDDSGEEIDFQSGAWDHFSRKQQ